MPTPANGSTLLTLSYWKSAAHLHAYAHSPTHRAGWDWWAKANKSYPHIGIMHETFAVPAGGWENIYQNFWPVGMGEARYLVGDGEEGGEGRLVSPLVEARGGMWRSMRTRMGGVEDVY